MLRQTPRGVRRAGRLRVVDGLRRRAGRPRAAGPARRGPADGRHRPRHPPPRPDDVRAHPRRAAARGDRRRTPGRRRAGTSPSPTRSRSCRRRPSTSWRSCASCRPRSRPESSRERARRAGRDPGRHRRRRAGRARALPPADGSGGSTASCSSSATASTSSTASAPACSSTRPSSCCASLGLADRLDRESLPHRGIQLAFDGRRHHIDFVELIGRSITVYGQQEVVKDLIAARLAAGDPIVFEALDVEPVDVDTDKPVIRYRHRRRAARAALPGRRRLRRLPRRVPRRSCPTAGRPSGSTRSPGSGSSPRPPRRRTS